VYCSSCALLPESLQSHFVLKNHISPCLLAFVLPKTCRLLRLKKKCPWVPSLPLFTFPSKNSYLRAFLPEITNYFLKWQFQLDLSIQVTFGHSQHATYNIEIKLSVVLHKSMSIKGEGASNKTDSSTKRTYTTPFSVTLE